MADLNAQVKLFQITNAQQFDVNFLLVVSFVLDMKSARIKRYRTSTLTSGARTNFSNSVLRASISASLVAALTEKVRRSFIAFERETLSIQTVLRSV